MRVNHLHSKTLKTLNKKNKRYKFTSPEKKPNEFEIIIDENENETQYESIIENDSNNR